MPPPALNSGVTQAQVDAAVNLADFPGSTPGNRWHIGQFEPWALAFGYDDGMPVYGSVNPGGYHLYWLNDGHQAPIILKQGQTPADYGVFPRQTAVAGTGAACVRPEPARPGKFDVSITGPENVTELDVALTWRLGTGR